MNRPIIPIHVLMSQRHDEQPLSWLVATLRSNAVEFEEHPGDFDPSTLTADQAAMAVVFVRRLGRIYVDSEHRERRCSARGKGHRQHAELLLTYQLRDRDLPPQEPTMLAGKTITDDTPPWMRRAIEVERAAVLRSLDEADE